MVMAAYYVVFAGFPNKFRHKNIVRVHHLRVAVIICLNHVTV